MKVLRPLCLLAWKNALYFPVHAHNALHLDLDALENAIEKDMPHLLWDNSQLSLNRQEE